MISYEKEKIYIRSTHIFTGLKDGKYIARGRAETLDGVILEEKELDVTIAYEQVYISDSGSDETGSGSKESPYASLNPAYGKVKSGGEMILLSDIAATETANLNTQDKEVTIRSEGENIYTILKDPSFTTQILDITNNNTVTTTNTTFDGNEVISSASLIEVRNSILNLNVGTTVQKNINYNSSGSNNTGGGILVLGNSILNVNNAQIINNKVSIASGDAQGGGIFSYNSEINIYSGIISGNEAVNGGGIYFNGDEDVVMKIFGGQILNNKAQYSGGGILITRAKTSISSTLYLKSNTVYNNIASVVPDVRSLNGANVIEQ